jgi:hypothetical protein
MMHSSTFFAVSAIFLAVAVVVKSSSAPPVWNCGDNNRPSATAAETAANMTRAQQDVAIARMRQRGEIGQPPEPTTVFVSISLRSLLDAIRQVETGGHADPVNAIGDGGASLGPYQIGRAYWTDADVEGRYEHVKAQRYAERVMLAYWSRYCFDALIDGDFETLARVHNGGPSGASKDATLDYWRRVSEIMAADVGNLNESEAAR